MTTRRKRKAKPQAATAAPSGPTTELLIHLATIERPADHAGQTPQRWLDAAHRRLRKNGKINAEHEMVVQDIVDAWLLYAHGGQVQGDSSDKASIITAQMYAGDVIRRFDANFGRTALLVIVASCVDCLRPATVAHTLLGFRAPENPAQPSQSWIDEGRKYLDKSLIILFRAMVQKQLDKTRLGVPKRIPSSELGIESSDNPPPRNAE